MAQNKGRRFVVRIYESEYRQMQAWVAKHQHIETGGDLFGLWADDRTAVVQLVLGPGENCRRSSVSFYQDIGYLERVGNVLTNREGLCHIGEWHSHHRIGLTRPSGGDENTVWTNMDRYDIHRFFLFIATIGSSTYDVNIGCFLFESSQNTGRPLSGEIHLFEGKEESPFRKSVYHYLEDGAESLNSSQWLNRFKSPRYTGKRSFKHAEQHQNEKKPRKSGPNKEACHATKISNDEELIEDSRELENQEDKPENIPVKDRGKSKLYEEKEESQGNHETGCNLFNTTDKNDNIKHNKQESPVGPLNPALSNDSHREDRHRIQIDQVMKNSIEDDDREVEPESSTTKDAEKSKISQEIENQRIESGSFFSVTTSRNDDVENVKRMVNLAENNNKTQNLKNQLSVTAKREKDQDASSPKDKKPKVQYVGSEEGKSNQESLLAKESGDVQATMVTGFKKIHPNHEVIEVEPANEDSNRNQPQDSNALDRNKKALKESSSKVCSEDEIQDTQKDERKQSSTNVAVEEMKSEDKTETLLQEKYSGTKSAKTTSKFSCFPIRKKTAKEKKKKNEEKKKEKKKKEEEKEERKKQKKEERKERKKQKKEEKKERKKQKKEEKKGRKNSEKRGK